MPPLNDTDRPVHLAGTTLQQHRHVCVFFHTAEERYRLLVPFVAEGMARGEKAIHIVDPAGIEDHIDRLDAGGVDVRRARKTGQLEVSGWDQVYLSGGRFDLDRMIGFVGRTLAAAREQGFPRTRVIGAMEWALEDRPGVDDLVRYETRVNSAFAGCSDPLICTYDRSRFGAGTAMDVFGAHPEAVVGGVLQPNPLFAAPRQLHSERTSRVVSALRKRYLTALLAGSRRDALDILIEDGLWLDVPVQSLYLDVLEPALCELGRLWQEGRIGVPQTCLAAEISKLALAQLRSYLPCRQNNGKLIVVACVEGEMHDIGAHLVADFLEMSGFDVRFLGPNIPTESLVALLEAQPPQLVALSATTDASLPALRRAVKAIQTAAGSRIPIAVGGRLISSQPRLQVELGVALYARTLDEMCSGTRALLSGLH